MNRIITKEILIDKLAESLDITPAQYQEAIKRFNNLKSYLENNLENPSIYLQGSFALGTTIRPVKKMGEREYDIDIVCHLQKKYNTLAELKNSVGDVLKSSVYNKYLDKEGKRCWTLNYKENAEEGFHIDILPCISEDFYKIQKLKESAYNPSLIDDAILITNKEEGTYSPKTSNPKGLGSWFDSISKKSLQSSWQIAKASVFEKNREFFVNTLGVNAMSTDVEYYVRTPLQRVIQILKRHRDVMFSNNKYDEKYKPISAIITVLSTKIAENNIAKCNSTYSLLDIVLNTIQEYASLTADGVNSDFLNYGSDKRLIEKLSDLKGWYIGNPANPGENLADRWHEDSNARARSFFEWVSKVKSDLFIILTEPDIEKIIPTISYNFGKQTADKVHSLCDKYVSENSNSNIISPTKPWRSND